MKIYKKRISILTSFSSLCLVFVEYELDYHKTEKWSFIDIALVKVESRYNLDDNSYKFLCSYIPTVIPINYENKFQKPGTDALVYGWGHIDIWRQVRITSAYYLHNTQHLNISIAGTDLNISWNPSKTWKRIYPYKTWGLS